MRSTGEVMGIDTDFARAFLKAQIGSGTDLPEAGQAFISVKDEDKVAMVELGRELLAMGFSLIATGGTARHLESEGLPVAAIKKVREGRPHIVDAMKSDQIQLVFNTTEDAKAIADSFELRRTALINAIPYYTTVAGARAAVQAILALKSGQLEVAPLQSYFKGSF
jgi:carbamoyl-phosphate synthase large subunit